MAEKLAGIEDDVFYAIIGRKGRSHQELDIKIYYRSTAFRSLARFCCEITVNAAV